MQGGTLHTVSNPSTSPLAAIVVAQSLPDSVFLDLLRRAGMSITQFSELPDLNELHQLVSVPQVWVADAGLMKMGMLRELRETIAAYAVMVILGDGDNPDLKIAYLNAGADAYFIQPVNAKVMFAHIRALLRRQKIFIDLPPEHPEQSKSESHDETPVSRRKRFWDSLGKIRKV